MKTFQLSGVLLVSAVLSGCNNYSAYQARAQVAEAAATVSLLKVDLMMLQADEERFPDSEESRALENAIPDSDLFEVTVIPDTGVVSVTFSDSADRPLRGKAFVIEPVATPGQGSNGISWRCRSHDIDLAYMSVGCR